ncbi:calcium-binding protein, partial [Pseudoalteromonas luteoviolacea]|uniref:calcium-binding protein n=1 Tax=Pseudoalteromonas luteoviolacea TaxID=43657 RepID=UPI0029C9C83F
MNFNNLVKSILDSKEKGWIELHANLAVLDSTLENYKNGSSEVIDVFLATADVLVATAGLMGADTLPGVVFNLESIKRNYQKYKTEKEAGVVGNDTIAALVASMAAVVNDITDALKTRHPGFAAAAVISAIITTVAKYVSVHASTAAQITEQLRQEQQGMIDIIQNQLSSRKQAVLEQYEALVRQEAALAGVDPAMAIDGQFTTDVNGLIRDLNDEINYKIQQSLELRIDLSHSEIEELKDQYIGEFNTILGGYGDGGEVTQYLNMYLGISVKKSRTRIINQAESDFAAELNGQGDARQKTTEFIDSVRQAFGQANIKNGNVDSFVNQWLAKYEGNLSEVKARILSELAAFKTQVLNGGILLVDEISEDLVGQYMTKQNELDSEFGHFETIAVDQQLTLMYAELSGLVVDDKKRYMSSVWDMHRDSAEALRHKAQRLAAQVDMQEGVDIPDSLFNQLGELYSEINGQIELSQKSVNHVLASYLQDIHSFDHFISNTNAYIEAESNRLDAGFSNIIALLQDIISQLESLLEQPPEEEPDEDGDGIPDDEDPDADGNGIPDSEEDPNNPSEKDSDGDGIPDHLDPDRDGDGIPNEDDPTPDGGSEGGDGGTPGDPAEEGSNNANRRRRIDPLILDLDGDGLEFISLDQSQAKFDLTGDGFATHTSWVKGDDGFLALDKNGDGKINDINELFGSESVTGFEELSALDSNGDGVINAQDAAFNDLLIWQDLNGDGHSSDNEISRLSDFGITEISLTRTAVGSESNDVILDEIGSYVRTDADGNQSSHILGDVQFTIRATYSEFIGEVTLTPDAIATGKVKGYGLMPDLDIAMSLDSAFSQIVMETRAGLTSENIFDRFDDMLISWANAEALTLEDIDSTPNLSLGEDGKVHFAQAGVSLSLAQLGVIKAYTGINNLELNDGVWAGNGGMQSTGRLYEQAWNNIRSNLLVKFAVSQGLTKDVLYTLNYDAATDQLHVPFDMSVSTQRMFELAVQKQGALDTKKKAADLLLLVNILNQFDGEFSNTASQLIKDTLVQAQGAAHQWLVDHQDTVNSVSSNLIFAHDVTGTALSEHIVASDLNNVINAGNGNDVVYARGGDDTIQAGSGNDTVYGGAGNDTITANGGNNTLEGGDGNDLVSGFARGNNTLRGGAGDDTLMLNNDYRNYSSSYSNTFEGGTGNDVLTGLYGKDTYLFNAGDGQDTLTDLGGVDNLVFGAGLSAEQLRVRRSGNDVVLYFVDAQGQETGDSITLTEAFSSSARRIEQLTFADGATLTGTEVHARALVMYGTEGNDTLTGSAQGDTLHGLAGDDVIDALGGNDTVYGGAGNDTITANGGNNTLEGGDGNDLVSGFARGNNTLRGGAGDDTLMLNNDYRNYSSSYSNTFEGGTGNDVLTGLYGKDTYLFNAGDGQDTLTDLGGVDNLVFGAGLSAEQLRVRRSGNDVVLYFVDAQGLETGDSITLTEAFSSSARRIEQLTFADGATLTGTEVHARALVMYGTEGNDTLTGSAQGDTLHGLAGDDVIDALGGNDTVYGGAGNDTITANGGNNTLEGGDGNDLVSGFARGNNTLRGGAGDDTLMLNNDYRNYSSSYSNTFEGGTGNDVLTGLYGKDTYLFNAGDGQDTLTDLGGVDNLVFGAGLSAEQLRVRRSGNDVVLYFVDAQGQETGDSITLTEAFSSSARRIEQLTFADGATLTGTEVHARALVMYGTEGNDTLTGSAQGDTLHGLAGDDVIDALGGNDTVYGGAGNDTITANGGNNTLEGGDGNDLVSGFARGNNTLRGGAGEDTLMLNNDYRNYSSSYSN